MKRALFISLLLTYSIICGAIDFTGTNQVYTVDTPYHLGGKTISLGKGSTIIMKKAGALNSCTLIMKEGSSINAEGRGVSKDLNICVEGSNVNISGLTWDNRTKNCLLSYGNCNNIHISRCSISATEKNCIKIVTDNLKGVASYIKIEDTSFSFNRMGIELQNHNNNDYKIDGVEIKHCTFTMASSNKQLGYGVSLSGYGMNAIVEGCTFIRVNTGIEIVGFKNVDISNNSFTDNIDCIIRSSNTRRMSDISITNNKASSPKAKLRLFNTENSTLSNNTLHIDCIEIKGCQKISVSDNSLTCYGHYAVILDGDKNETKDNIINDNDISHKGNRWATIRCYGAKCKNNRSYNNKIDINKKSGKSFDQINGASSNNLK